MVLENEFLLYLQRLRRIKDRVREMSLWFQQVMRENEDDEEEEEEEEVELEPPQEQHHQQNGDTTEVGNSNSSYFNHIFTTIGWLVGSQELRNYKSFFTSIGFGLRIPLISSSSSSLSFR